VHLVGFYYKKSFMSVTLSTWKWIVERLQEIRFSRICYDQGTGNVLQRARQQCLYQCFHIPGNLLYK